MKDRELKRMSRAQLLELMIEQSREIEKLRVQLEQAREQLQSREIKLSRCGSIAEASLAIMDVFSSAQRAADLYLENVKRAAEEAAPDEKTHPKPSGTAGDGGPDE